MPCDLTQGSGEAQKPTAAFPGLSRAVPFWLLSLLLLTIFLTFEPYAANALFGSDTGEYFRLTAGLVASGHLVGSGTYTGWGFAYPEFPGIFIEAGAVAGAVGSDVLTALLVVIPLLAALALLPLFLLFRQMFRHDTVALLGAALATIVVPRLFTIAHPAPLALGDLLVVAGLWMFLEGRRDVRWYLPLSLSAGALVVTHHLSSYFFLVSALGGLLLFELGRPSGWSRRFPLRELCFLAGFSSLLFLYWIDYAVRFGNQIVVGEGFSAIGAATPAILILAGVLGVVLVGVFLKWWRRRAHSRVRVRVPSDRSVLRDAVLIAGSEAVGVGALLFLPLPGTQGLHATLGTILFFLPYLAVIPLASGSRRFLSLTRTGPFAIAWLAAIGLSTLFALASNNQVLPASRASEYLVIPLGLLAAVGLGHWVSALHDRVGRKAGVAAATGVLVLLTANAALIYPPPQDFEGFEEALTVPDAVLWMWGAAGLPPGTAVASDHRLSSMIFGFDGLPATWWTTPFLFTGSNATAAWGELRLSGTPTAPEPIRAVAVDASMYTGVALDPSKPALPLSASAQAWFMAPPFVPLYENGAQAVYWVAGSPPPSL